MMSLSLDEPRPIDSRGRASPPGEASSGEYPVSYYLQSKKQVFCSFRCKSAKPNPNPKPNFIKKYISR